MSDPLKPSPTLLCKLGSLVVHLEEAMSNGGHAFDIIALKSLKDDAEVKAWFAAMTGMAMLPVKRSRPAHPDAGAAGEES